MGDIGTAVITAVEGEDCKIVRDLVGHGVGREVHEEPQVPNIGRPGHGPLLREGMVLAIEPMLSAGSPEIRTLDDGWTVITADKALSAHFEHTVAVTAQGPKVLTTLESSFHTVSTNYCHRLKLYKSLITFYSSARNDYRRCHN